MALATLDKEEVIKKQEKFDDFFKRSRRLHGQDMAEYVRDKQKRYQDLRALDATTQLSDDLYAYFLLEGARLREDQRKMITLVADSEYDTKSFEKTLRTSFHDAHLSERRTPKEVGGDRSAGRFGKRRPSLHRVDDTRNLVSNLKRDCKWATTVCV